ncbi:B3 domain-containing protein REM10-like [Capsicum annuum]|uniref:B3 domain-containing protein REM10-like n=1 Tax=Capsicum annuum TaxID=4072 RepID=UPI001FB0E7A0|nr:B3 domain-containing protein REM10-like [Capsicum annuum]
MKIAPKKPHFFKPIMPGFKRGLKIPIGFLRYLKGLKHIKHAILRRASKKWLLKVNCWRLEDGWKKFAKEHDLQLGDLLVFRHEGHMEFKVSIFDSSHCDREYAEYLREEEESNTIEETSKKVKFKEAAIHNPCGQSRFECIVRPYCVSNGYLVSLKTHWIKEAFAPFCFFPPLFIGVIYSKSMKCFICANCYKQFLRLPRQFARANGLMNKKLGVIIRDERQRSWNLRLATYGLNVHIYNGWDEFCVVNNLKEGDYMTFEVVANGEKPIWKFRLIKDLRHKALDLTTPISQIPASTSADANPHFISTIKHYTFTKAILKFEQYLPKGFTKSNGMMDKHEMILVDEKQRSWTVWLGKMDPRHFGIKCGWPQFRKANGVQVGDTYMFELTDNGTIPIMHVHYMKEPTVDVMASLSCSAPIEKA